MNDDQSSEKTEAPTDKKIRDARDRGQIVQSKDFGKFIIILTFLIYLFFAGRGIFFHVSNGFSLIFKVISEHERLSLNIIFRTVFEIGTILLSCLMPVFIIGLIAFIFQLFQTKGIFFKEEWIKFDAFNPVSNFKQIFALTNIIKLLKNVCEVIVIACTAIAIIYYSINDFILLVNYDFLGIIYYLIYFLAKLIIPLVLIYFVFASLDYYMEYHKWYKQLKMTKEEVKQEHKETNGSPEVKNRQRELMRELLGNDSDFDPNDASFILANPTHIAIVVLYSPLRWSLPVILLKAKDYKAFEVFKLAKRFNLPIIRDVWLARSLYEIAEAGKYVPTTMLKGMAALINKNLDILPNVVSELNIVKQRHNSPNLAV